MGWLIVLVLRPFVMRMHPTGLMLVIAGGLFYTFGVPFYLANRMRYNHLIWHLFVLLGSTCHFLATLWYAAG